jgi:5-methylcytosine-specific restriction endonuclease McrA
MRRRTVNAHKKRIVGARAGWRCEYCGAVLDETYEVHHEVQFALGGSDDYDNLRASCRPCHGKITVRQEAERLERRARAAAAATPRPPLSCTRCDRIVSPYFVHRC